MPRRRSDAAARFTRASTRYVGRSVASRRYGNPRYVSGETRDGIILLHITRLILEEFSCFKYPRNSR